MNEYRKWIDLLTAVIIRIGNVMRNAVCDGKSTLDRLLCIWLQ